MKSDLLTVSLNKVQINGNYARCFITSAVDKFSEGDLASNQQKHPSLERYLFREIAFTFLPQLFKINTCNLQYKTIVMLNNMNTILSYLLTLKFSSLRPHSIGCNTHNVGE